MKSEYVILISELDKTISMARSLWIDAKEAAEKPKWFARINELLDERLRLMALRDSKQ